MYVVVTSQFHCIGVSCDAMYIHILSFVTIHRLYISAHTYIHTYIHTYALRSCYDVGICIKPAVFEMYVKLKFNTDHMYGGLLSEGPAQGISIMCGSHCGIMKLTVSGRMRKMQVSAN